MLKQSLKNKTFAAKELYRHLYDLKDWTVEDNSINDYLKEMCQDGLISDYLHKFS